MEKSLNEESIAKLKTFDMDHLGIVAGIVDDIGLVEEIDRELGTHEQEVLSPGVVVKAIQSSWTNGGFERLGLCQSAALPGAKLFREQTD
jgi:hypothetical protein